MFCNRKIQLKQVAVNNPEALNEEPWVSHLNDCPECKDEKSAYVISLAVFQSFETESRHQQSSAITWSQFSEILTSRHLRQAHKRKRFFWAAAASVLLVSGLVTWQTGNFSYTDNARVVKVPRSQQIELLKALVNTPTRRQAIMASKQPLPHATTQVSTPKEIAESAMKEPGYAPVAYGRSGFYRRSINPEYLPILKNGAPIITEAVSPPSLEINRPGLFRPVPEFRR